MGRVRTPQKNPMVPPAAAATAVPIACRGGTSGTAPTAPVAMVATQGSTAPSVPIAGPSKIAGPSTVLALPLTASLAPRSSSTLVPSIPHALSPMQEDEPELLIPDLINSIPNIKNRLTFTEDDLLDFLDTEEETPLANRKGKGKEAA